VDPKKHTNKKEKAQVSLTLREEEMNITTKFNTALLHSQVEQWESSE